jgi:sensor c-di-GMP phosphodiesterase-like protein
VVARHALTLAIGLLILALLASMLLAIWIDIEDVCREAILDELWDDDA